jgi:putative oxidoreductase
MTGILELLLPYTGYLALGLRVWLGASFIVHGRPKMGPGMAQTTQWIQSMGLPPVAAYSAATLEVFGGLFLIVGLLVPLVALFFAVFMASNIVMKKTKMHEGYISPGKPSYEVDALYLGLSLVLFVLGAGALSLDGALGF